MPYTATVIKAAVDWNNDGDFSDAWEDVTKDAKYIRFSRGKDAQLGSIAQTGTLEMSLNNTHKRYSPENASSPLYGNLLPKRVVYVYAEVKGAASPTDLFYGYIEDITPHPFYTEKDVYIQAVDGFDYLSRQELDTVLWKSAVTGTVIGSVLDAAAWPAAKRTIDTGIDTIPYAYWHKVMALAALREIEKSELGFLYINGSGNLVYEDRHHRYKAAHWTSAATFNERMKNITYDYGAKSIYNEIRATVTPWQLQSIAEVWRCYETPSVPAAGTIEIWADFSAFIDVLTNPVANTDYTANSQADGLGTDLTASVSIVTTAYAQAAKLAITNNAAVTAYMTLLKLRATQYDDKTQITRKASNAASQTAYQKRTLTLDGKFLTSAAVAQDYCNYAVSRYKDPQPEVTLSLVNKDDNYWSNIVTLNLSDRITVVNSELGLNTDFFINRMEHEISEGGKLHRVTWTLDRSDEEEYWCMDYSALGTNTRLSY